VRRVVVRRFQHSNIGFPATCRTFGKWASESDLVDVDALHICSGDTDRHVGVRAAAQDDHSSRRPFEHDVGGHDGIVRGHHQVEGIRAAGSHQVGDLLEDDAPTREAPDHIIGDGTDTTELALPIRSGPRRRASGPSILGG
jgi:hypothetical protein